MPAKAKGSVARPRVIRERKLRAKVRAARAGSDGYRHGASARDRVGGEFFANAANSTPTFG